MADNTALRLKTLDYVEKITGTGIFAANKYIYAEKTLEKRYR
jgi:hypothetical protein